MTEQKKKTSTKKAEGKTNVYSSAGESVGTVELNPQIFNRLDVKDVLIHQVASAMLSNSRNTVATTKDRSQARGGGKKPWRQKGTGRARAGSIRSPLWRGGGVTFGPTSARNFKKKINKREKQMVLFAVFSDRAKEGKVVVVEKFKVEAKTKKFSELLEGLKKKIKQIGDTVLILTAEKNDDLVRAARNLRHTTVRQVTDFSVLDLLAHESIVIEKEGLQKLEQIQLKDKR